MQIFNMSVRFLQSIEKINMRNLGGVNLKGYCTVFQHALKSLEITGIVLSKRMLKTARKNSKGLKSYKEFKF